MLGVRRRSIGLGTRGSRANLAPMTSRYTCLGPGAAGIAQGEVFNGSRSFRGGAASSSSGNRNRRCISSNCTVGPTLCDTKLGGTYRRFGCGSGCASHGNHSRPSIISRAPGVFSAACRSSLMSSIGAPLRVRASSCGSGVNMDAGTRLRRDRMAEFTPMLAASPWLCALVPVDLLPGTLANSEHRWIFEQFVGYGSATMGVQGLVSLGIFFNPLFEAMPRIRRDASVGKMPLLPYSAMASQGLVWTVYGILVSNPAIWTPNFCALVLGIHYWSVYNQYCPKDADWLPLTQRLHRMIFSATALLCASAVFLLEIQSALILLGVAGNIMTLKMFGGPLAAIGTVVREKNTKAMAFGFTCAININCNLWFFYAYCMLDDPYIYIQDGLGLALTTIQLMLFARYGIHR
mmetsp:Transcript_79090/g.155171  ORF Transcript_79090/g.155171 Transcript_79090/m.155171 type:complete len:405 (+) Transcript_79090:59-1273(+)